MSLGAIRRWPADWGERATGRSARCELLDCVRLRRRTLDVKSHFVNDPDDIGRVVGRLGGSGLGVAGHRRQEAPVHPMYGMRKLRRDRESRVK